MNRRDLSGNLFFGSFGGCEARPWAHTLKDALRRHNRRIDKLEGKSA
jgi:hypothetical protein